MDRYYVKRPTGKVFGPFDENAIRLMLDNNKIGGDAEVSTDKQSWQPIADVEAFGSSVDGGSGGGGSAELPASANNAPDLPKSKSGSGGPQLPKPKSGSGGPQLPKPKSKSGGPELPKPKSKSGGPQLPKPKAGSGGPELPKSKSDGPELPRSSQDNLPQSGQDELPRSSQDNLPQSGQDELPRSSQDNLPQSDGGPPPAEPPEDDDLFGSPIEDDDDDLFDSPADDGLDDDSDDLFGSPAGLDDDSDDLFDSPAGLDDDSDDLFDSPADEGLDDDSDDLFGSPDDGLDDDSDDLFGSPDDGLDDDSDDLFGSSEPDDDDLFADDPGDEDDDDFLGGGDSFSFLEDKDEDDADDGGLEDWERDIEPTEDDGGADDDWGDDLLDDDPPTNEPSAPKPGPAAGGGSPAPSPEVDEQFRPASSGIKDPDQYGAGTGAESAKASKEDTVEADKKRGLMSLVGIILVGLLLFGGGGFGLYQAFLADDDTDVEDDGPQYVELHVDDLRSDTYNALDGLISQAETGDLDTENRARLLMAKSLFLTRYDDESVAAEASQLADELAGSDDPTVTAALATHEGRLGEPDATRALAEPIADDPDVGFFAHLAMGIADATAHFEGEEFTQTLELDDDEATAEAAQLDSDPGDLIADDDGIDIDETTESDDEEVADEDEEIADEDEEIADEDEEGEDDGEDDAAEDRRLADRAAEHFALAAEADASSATPHFWLARLALYVDDSDDAIGHLEDAATADPGHVPSRLQAGRIYYERGDLNDAAEHLREIIDAFADEASDEERAEALHLMGMVHQARQESEEAIDLMTRALNADSSRTDTLQALAREYERAEKYDEALNFFTTDDNLSQEDPEVMLGIVRSYMGLERWTSAINQLEEGEEQFPDDARFPHKLGLLNEERNNLHEARDAYDRAVDIDPDILAAHTALARLAWQVDSDPRQADEHIAEIVERSDLIDAPIAASVADVYHMSEHHTLARKWNEEALRRDPNYWESRLALARIYLDEHETDQALDLLERAREEGIQDLRLSAYLADAYRQNEQFDRAIDEINQVLAEESDSAEYLFIRGLIYFDRGDYTTARENFTNAYDIDPRFHEAYFYVGRTALVDENYAQAIRIFRHVLDYQPDNGEFQYYLGRTFEAEDSTSQALDAYSQAISADPDYVEENPDVLVRRGRLLADLGRTEQAASDIERAVELDPEDTQALMAIGSVHYQEGEYEDAIEHYSEALEEDPDHPIAQYELGMSYIHEDQDELGARHLQRAVRHGYDNPDVYRTLGYLYRDLGQRSDALESFKTFLRESQDGQIAESTQNEIFRQIEDLGG